jgi:hypothetical protein
MRPPIAAAPLTVLLAGVLAACGATPPPAATSAQPSSATSGGGTAVGYDCPTLLTPAELDAASGLTGGNVTTNRRGDKGASGAVMGITECGIEYAGASTWFGHFNVVTGSDGLANFDASWSLAEGQGATSVGGVGSAALLQSDASGVHMWARGSNGVAVTIGIAWDEESTTEDAVKAAERQILTTVLSRT